MQISVVAIVLFYAAYVSAVTPVQKCPQGKSPEEFKQSVTIGNCKTARCKLRKKSTFHLEFRFTPDRNVNSLSNTVKGIIVGLPFPFLGVDGTDACNQLYAADGTTKASCPLKAGTEYVYKNQFPILEIYPLIRVLVHYALTANDGKDVLCFRVQAKIAD